MDFKLALIRRLGWDEYAFNIVVNLKEDGLLVDGYRQEDEDFSLKVNYIDGKHQVIIRHWVQSMGWKTAEITL
jgi:hypothetical protein